MSIPKNPDPAKLVIGCIMNDKTSVEDVYPMLEEAFGPVDLISRWLNFSRTISGRERARINQALR